jgi:hypothetical protein
MASGRMLMQMNLLAFLAVAILAGVLAFQMWLYDKNQKSWMRIFSVKSLEIPPQSMDASQPTEENEKRARDNRKRLSIPLPVPDYAKDVYRSVKRG